jgi:hypothetical protein
MKTKQNSGQLFLARSKIDRRYAKGFVCHLSSALLVAVAWMGTAQLAVGQDVRGFLATAGVNEDGTPVIDFLDSEGTCVEAVVPNVSGVIGCAVLDWHGDPELSEVVVTFSLGAIYHIPSSNFHPCPEGLKRVTGQRSAGSPRSARVARRAAPSPSPTPIVVPVSNDADSLAVSCDGRFAVVVGSTSFSQTNTPVSLEDLDAHKEIATVPYSNKLARAAAIGDDGQTVLASLDDSSGGGASAARRLTLNETKRHAHGRWSGACVR